jgi:ABC-type nickel/cobalt efflux system permease component RcnA
VKGTVRQALALGLIVAITHTIGVLAIGLVTLFGLQYILPERLYPYLSLASGLMILALGVRLIARAGGLHAWHRFASVVRRGPARASGHGHGHDHPHSHEPAIGAPPWKNCSRSASRTASRPAHQRSLSFWLLFRWTASASGCC